MGVTGLWTVVQPCARPIKIETLNKKRLAVDASIWVYQFLKAVRDKEGNALRNSHVVGFFRRLCKLLFFGIKPVFVFDGGAPSLKRQTITARKNRREGRREDAVRTAGKLLAMQMQRHAEDEDERRRTTANTSSAAEAPLPENLVYVDELSMTTQERQSNRSFKKKDQYHLPQLDVPLSEMGGPNDPRVMSMEELETYARQFDAGEDINVYDFSKIDFDSPFFTSLPAADRYNILNAARLRSRLRMGLSKDQLDKMFPNRMDFSRFQIERVRERNELTARLMNINNGDADWDITGRISGEKGREYFLVKNSGVEGGWALGVVGDRDKEEGKESRPIDVDQEQKPINLEEDSEVESETGKEEDHEEIERRRRAFYDSRKKLINPDHHEPSAPIAGGSMFVGDQVAGDPATEMSEQSDEEADLQRAIAMSLETEDKKDNSADEEEEFERAFNPALFQQKKAEDFNPFSKSSLGHVAQVANNRARRAAPARGPLQQESDDEFDLQGALAESRQSKRKASPPTKSNPPATSAKNKKAEDSEKPKTGPLPFEKLNLGASLLGKKKMDKIEEQSAGGFDRMATLTAEKSKPAAPLPPWFADRDIVEDVSAQRKRELEARRKERERTDEHFEFEQTTLRRRPVDEIIDIDEYDAKKKAPLLLESSDEEDAGQKEDEALHRTIIVQDDAVRMGDVAEKVLVEPPTTTPDSPKKDAEEQQMTDIHPALADRDDDSKSSSPKSEIEWEESDYEGQTTSRPHTTGEVPDAVGEDAKSDSSGDVYLPPDIREQGTQQQDRPKSDSTTTAANAHTSKISTRQAPIAAATEEDDSAEDSAHDVYIPPEFLAPGTEPSAKDAHFPEAHQQNDEAPVPASGTANQNAPLDDDGIEAEEDYSDPEEEELMIALANEAEEHARFASQLNNKSQKQNIEEYERELKALRTQQKKDRRDADEVTQIMISECQQLLKLFGLPYITAPMEAEAQCAELVRLGLVDGIVTDDSDTFLFGGTRVYKNMFNQAKFVECYLSTDLEKEFDLTRDKLINIAHLLGSDYTEGLPGIGPVNALEIIGEFADLRAFKEWWSAVQNTLKPAELDANSAFRKKFRRANINKLFLPTSFPDLRVNEAYHHPEVDSDPSPFQWGVPDLDALRAFLMATIGWGQERTDEVLVPVIRDMNRREKEGTQANITNFVAGGAGAGAFAPRVRDTGKSKRMEGALNRMAAKARNRRRAVGSDADEDVHVDVETSTIPPEDAVIAIPGSQAASTHTEAKERKAQAEKKRKAKRHARDGDGDVDGGDDDEDDDTNGDTYKPPAKKRKAKAKTKATSKARR